MEKYKYHINEEFVIKVFNQIENIEIDLNNNIMDIGDFKFKLNGKDYIVEVKTRFSSTLLSRTLIYMREVINRENATGIIVVLDKIPESLKKSIESKYNNLKIFDISNVLYMVYENENLQKELNSIINFSLDSIIPQKPVFEIELKDKEEYIEHSHKDYKNILDNIKKGREDAKKYEKFMEMLIKEMFLNDLNLFVAQNRTEDGLNVFDMICKIKNNIDDEFFSTIENFFNSKYILFEFKNYRELIKQGEICTTEKYLFNTALRNVAIIITRKGIDKNGQKMIRGILRESGKLIIVLNDEDIKAMIELYENNERVSIILSQKLDEILTTLDK